MFAAGLTERKPKVSEPLVGVMLFCDKMAFSIRVIFVGHPNVIKLSFLGPFCRVEEASSLEKED